MFLAKIWHPKTVIKLEKKKKTERITFPFWSIKQSTQFAGAVVRSKILQRLFNWSIQLIDWLSYLSIGWFTYWLIDWLLIFKRNLSFYFRGLPKRTPSDTLGHIFRMSSRRDYACQCNLSTEQRLEEEKENGESAINELNDVTVRVKSARFTERRSDSAGFSDRQSGVGGTDGHQRPQSAAAVSHRSRRRSARSSTASTGTHDHNDMDGGSEESDETGSGQDDPEDCESSYSQSQASVFHSEESLHQDLNPSEMMYRDILIRRSRERDGGGSRPSSADDILTHRSVPDLKDAVSISQSLNDYAVSPSRRASSGEAEEAASEKSLRFFYSNNNNNNLPESQVWSILEYCGERAIDRERWKN